ncbi:MAG TPA: hypothetical protein VGM37_01120 [Armatimonadota bacterium]|jgi:hypothetical protein
MARPKHIAALGLAVSLTLAGLAISGCARRLAARRAAPMDTGMVEAMAHLPGESEATWKQAREQLRRGRPADAIPLYRSILPKATAWPASAAVRVGLAAALIDQGALPEAILRSGEAIDLCAAHNSPDDFDTGVDGPVAALVYGHAVALQQGIRDRAALEEAFRTAPAQRRPFLGAALAQAQWADGDRAARNATLRRVAAMDPAGACGRSARSLLQRVAYGPRGADRPGQRGVSEDPRMAAAADSALTEALRLDHQGMHDAAIRRLQSGIAQAAGHSSANRLRLQEIRILSAQGNRRQVQREADALFQSVRPVDAVGVRWCVDAARESGRAGGAPGRWASPATYGKLAASHAGLARGYYEYCMATAMEIKGDRRGALAAFRGAANRYRGSELAVMAAIEAGLTD